jgi:hypothetical protein
MQENGIPWLETAGKSLQQENSHRMKNLETGKFLQQENTFNMIFLKTGKFL